MLIKVQRMQAAKERKILDMISKDDDLTENALNMNLPTFEKYLLDLLIENINKNISRDPRGYRYYKDIIDFFYCIKYGPKPYESMRRIIPIPTVQTLKIRKNKHFNIIKESML